MNLEDLNRATINEAFNKVTEEKSDSLALVFEDVELTYDELKKEAYNVAIKLKELGIKKGDRVAILLSNCYEYLYLYFGAFLIGAWPVPITSRVKEKELKNILMDSKAELIFLQDSIDNRHYEKIVFGFKDELPFLDKFIIRRTTDLDKYFDMPSFSDFFEMINNIEEKIERFEHPDIQEDDTALLAYTSGTTGNPKGVMITHRGLVYTSYHTGRIWGYDQIGNDLVLSIAPLYTAQGFLPVLLDLISGVTMNFLETFTPNKILKEISKGRAKIFHTQPTMWNLLMFSPLRKFVSFDNLEKTIVSGSLCSSNLAKRIYETTDTTLLNGYGLIEATGVVTVTRPDDPLDVQLNTVGRPIPGVNLKIVDQNHNEVEKGEVGELAVRGYLMNGYYGNEEKTKSVIDEEGWLYTGDLACYYKDGENIQIVGRNKDMIIRGGFNVYPIDIEEEISNCNKVQDVAVVGKEHEILGEVIVAFIVPDPSMKITKGEIMEHCKEYLSDYKMPDEIYFVKQLPTLLSGKIRKNILKEWLNTEIPQEELFNF
jgi:fatty-acyl-CoA synthase